MPCYFPVGTYTTEGENVYRPCGSCIGCRLEYSRQWAVRCVHEASLNKDNCFITLTYNKESLPEDKSLNKKHVQKFIKKLRKKIEPHKIRYFGCGEYGERYHRPHYHICIFGYMFNDLKLIRYGKKTRFKNRFRTGNNYNLYYSKMLENTWKKGFVTVGDLTFESAGYTARYITKKVILTNAEIKRTGKTLKDYYGEKNLEFAIMSRRPGIGTTWIDQYMSDVYPKDFFTMRGHKMRPNRFYDDRYKKTNPEGFKKVKEKRKIHQQKKGDNPAKKLIGYHKERHRKNVTKTLERKMENETR